MLRHFWFKLQFFLLPFQHHLHHFHLSFFLLLKRFLSSGFTHGVCLLSEYSFFIVNFNKTALFSFAFPFFRLFWLQFKSKNFLVLLLFFLSFNCIPTVSKRKNAQMRANWPKTVVQIDIVSSHLSHKFN